MADKPGNLGKVKEFFENQTGYESAGENRKLKSVVRSLQATAPVFYSDAQGISQKSHKKNYGKMKCKVLYGNRRGSGFSQGVSFSFWKEAGPELRRKVLEIRDELCMLVPSSPLYDKKPHYDCHNHTNRGGGHAKRHGIFPLEPPFQI